MNGLNDIERVKQLYAIIVHGQLPDDPDSIQKKIDIITNQYQKRCYPLSAKKVFQKIYKGGQKWLKKK